ncbi:eukaryotic translation initiation factor 3 subunit A [Quaeritorhiza haematococci]|nr:eukaryotic translation initiation factor 3 subunit A [Quaeritorhiza haematococci]
MYVSSQRMAPFHRPENALRRADELLAVGQTTAALQLLHELILSKRSRSTPLTTLEPVMLKFVELCVSLRKGKTAKEGLHQYKNISQNITVTTIELVIKRFIELSEQKVAEAQSKADKLTLDAIEDLEASETPESIILSTVSGEGSKERTDREVVTPWLKFLWEAYRTALDILRNNARLELLYQSVANQAFQFCLKYTRKTEFRRLCELLRQHLATAAKYAHQAHAINLNDPDTLQRHLDTRFVQLNAAAELELWQEAFRSVEDIHNLLAMSKKPPKAFMMANYYEKLSRIFMVGENYLFHAAAWNKYYLVVRQNKHLSEEEHQRMASIVLMSALAIPIITTSKTRGSYLDMDENKPKLQRLTNLLRVPRAPTREVLLKEALNKNLLARVQPELRELYNILEVQFHPLSICKKIAPIMASIAKQPELAKYTKPLHSVILTRLLQQLSQVYTTIEIESVVRLASFPEPYNYDKHRIEKFIMNGCKKGELSIRINHQTQTLTFENDLFSASKGTISEGPRLQSLPSEQMRLQLVRLSKRLHMAVSLIDPQQKMETMRENKKNAIATALKHMEEEHKATFIRRLLIEKKKELRENELMRKEKEEQRLRAIRQQQEAEAERIRLEEESKKREQERLRAQRAEIEKAEAKKIAEKLAEELKAKNLKLKPEDLEQMDTNKLYELQVQQLETEKQNLANKLRTVTKKFDYVQRAIRKEEIPLLEADYENQKKIDLAYYQALRKAQLEAAKIQHQENMETKGRLLRMLDDYKSFKAKLDKEREAEVKALKAEAARRLEEAKRERREEVLARREEERRAKEEEERLRLKKEEEERRKQEEFRRNEEKRLAEDAARRAEEAERRKKLDEIAEKQAAREREIEERLRQRERETRAPPPIEKKEEPTMWRRRELPREEEPAPVAAVTGGRYVPPSKRTAPAPATGEKEVWRPRAPLGDRDRETSDRPWRPSGDADRRPPARDQEDRAWRPRRAEEPQEERSGVWRRGGARDEPVRRDESGWRERMERSDRIERSDRDRGEREAELRPRRPEGGDTGVGAWRRGGASTQQEDRWRKSAPAQDDDRQEGEDDGFTTVQKSGRRR